MSKEEKIKALESLLKWLQDGGISIVNEPYFGMCTWVRGYHSDEGMNDGETEHYLLSLGLTRPAHEYCHWFPTKQSHERISLVKQTIEILKSES